MNTPRTSFSPRLVATRPALEALASEIASEPAVAIDTESNSFHAYRERVCLIQISTRSADYILDPLSVDVRPLGQVILDPARETVLHGADYDVRCLKREFGWVMPRLFDTMAAARRLGRTGLGLSALVEARFGVRLTKDHQRSDWGRRPLTSQQIAYASRDTHYLLPLYDHLVAELAGKGLLGAARVEFARIAAGEARPKVFDPEGYHRMAAARELDDRGRALLRALYVAREARASELDRPPFKVLSEQAMTEIARRRPQTLEDLAGIPGITPSVLRRMGDLIRAALADAD